MRMGGGGGGGGENDAISVIENQREWETGEFWD
jgi:hypothetical protein